MKCSWVGIEVTLGHMLLCKDSFELIVSFLLCHVSLLLCDVIFNLHKIEKLLNDLTVITCYSVSPSEYSFHLDHAKQWSSHNNRCGQQYTYTTVTSIVGGAEGDHKSNPQMLLSSWQFDSQGSANVMWKRWWCRQCVCVRLDLPHLAWESLCLSSLNLKNQAIESVQVTDGVWFTSIMGKVAWQIDARVTIQMGW